MEIGNGSCGKSGFPDGCTETGRNRKKKYVANGIRREEMPQISVVVPVYKVEDYLARCVDSILKQSFSDFELILVDDGSPDSCGTICDEYARKDPRVLVIHQENGGLSAARNAGIDWVFAHSDSQWFTFIDSDDWVHEKYLEYLYKAAKKYQVLVAIGGYQKTGGESPSVDESRTEGELWETATCFKEHNINSIVSWGKLINRKCFEGVRFPVGRLHEDEFTTHKLLFIHDQVVYIPEPLYAYYENPASITRVAWSPRRMDALDAYVERIEYFRQHSHESMFRWTLSVYIWYIIAMREMLIKLNNELSEEYSKVLFKRLRKELIRYRKDAPIEKFAGAYELAFPCEMRVYWIAAAVKGKMKNLLGRG
jgi:glycosyltransferase involved in cell wall biosynthesis